jgi:hypothetical protein
MSFSKTRHDVFDALINSGTYNCQLITLYTYLQRSAVFPGQKKIPTVRWKNGIRKLKVGEIFFTYGYIASLLHVSSSTAKRRVERLQDYVPLTIETAPVSNNGGVIVRLMEPLFSNSKKGGEELKPNQTTIPVANQGFQAVCEEEITESCRPGNMEDGKTKINNPPTSDNTGHVYDPNNFEEGRLVFENNILKHFKAKFPWLEMSETTLAQNLEALEMAKGEKYYLDCINKLASDPFLAFHVRGLGNIFYLGQKIREVKNLEERIKRGLSQIHSEESLDDYLEFTLTSKFHSREWGRGNTESYFSDAIANVRKKLEDRQAQISGVGETLSSKEPSQEINTIETPKIEKLPDSVEEFLPFFRISDGANFGNRLLQLEKDFGNQASKKFKVFLANALQPGQQMLVRDENFKYLVDSCFSKNGPDAYSSKVNRTE